MCIILRLICEILSGIAVEIKFLWDSKHGVYREASFKAIDMTWYLCKNTRKFTSIILHLNIISLSDYLIRVLTRVLKWWVPGLITFENGESHQILVSPNPKMMSPDLSYNKPLSESLIFHKSLVYSLLILHAVSFKCIYKLK